MEKQSMRTLPLVVWSSDGGMTSRLRATAVGSGSTEGVRSSSSSSGGRAVRAEFCCHAGTDGIPVVYRPDEQRHWLLSLHDPAHQRAGSTSTTHGRRSGHNANSPSVVCLYIYFTRAVVAVIDTSCIASLSLEQCSTGRVSVVPLQFRFVRPRGGEKSLLTDSSPWCSSSAAPGAPFTCSATTDGYRPLASTTTVL